MLKVASFDIVFQEIPGEVTLALNLSGCPCHCPGCHSPHLAEDIGEVLDEALLEGLMDRYGKMITCVAFMGGDANPGEVINWAERVKDLGMKAAWYSGRPGEPESYHLPLTSLDYVKFGPYIESLGGLKSETTNQRMYKRVGDGWEDITATFRRNTLGE